MEFRNGLAKHRVVATQALDVVVDPPRISLEEDFMRLYPKRSIEQLINNKEDGIFIVMATIDSFVEDGDWWYPTCRCHMVVIPDSCVCHFVNVTFRYKIKLKVGGESGAAVFVLFDRDG